MQEITGDEPAFSAPDTICADGNRTMPLQCGLTIRQHFAAMAMQSLLSANKVEVYDECYFGCIAKEACRAATALIDELNKPK